jgi:hypothetical protein
MVAFLPAFAVVIGCSQRAVVKVIANHHSPVEEDISA